ALCHVALRHAGPRADAAHALSLAQHLQAQIFLARAAAERDGAVAVTRRIAQAVERHAAADAETLRGLRAVLEHGHGVPTRAANLVVRATEQDQVLAAEGAAVVAHEGDDERALGPALR